MELSDKQKQGIRVLRYESKQSPEAIAKATGLPITEIEAVLAEPDPLTDFQMYHFGNLTRKLYDMANLVMGSISERDLEDAPISSRSTLLRTSLDVMQKAHDLHMIHKDKNEDFKLARLLSMGRQEAREALVERFRSLAQVLFGGMSEKELMHLLKSMAKGEDPSGGDAGGQGDGGGEAELLSSGTSPHLSLVSNGGEVRNEQRSNTAPAGRSGQASQGIGAFRGPKKS